ncbi:MAG: hypothetical protein AOA65_0068 [Candidatus Bathyarchaeota archaeon BA1]|nr:MAG: hypothetical protein AOA65_0068 [Candidatus Bathyarchaeota archaeon BA1]
MECSVHEKMKTAVKRYFESRGSVVKIEKCGDVLPEYVDCLVIEDNKCYGVECETSVLACFEHLNKIHCFDGMFFVYLMGNLSKKALPVMIGKKKVRVLPFDPKSGELFEERFSHSKSITDEEQRRFTKEAFNLILAEDFIGLTSLLKNFKCGQIDPKKFVQYAANCNRRLRANIFKYGIMIHSRNLRDLWTKRFGARLSDRDLDFILEFLRQATIFLKGKKEEVPNEVDPRMVG